MNKYVKFFGVAALASVLVLATAAVTFAQTAGPVRAGGRMAFAATPAPGYGQGLMGGRFGQAGGMMGGYGQGMMGGYGQAGGVGMGLLSEYQDLMHAEIAKALDLTLEQFNAALAEGQTPYTLAQEKGVEAATLQAAMLAGHQAALEQAVADGQITQEQADWMAQRQGQMAGWMAGGRFGAGANGTCPMLAPAPAPQN